MTLLKLLDLSEDLVLSLSLIRGKLKGNVLFLDPKFFAEVKTPTSLSFPTLIILNDGGIGLGRKNFLYS